MMLFVVSAHIADAVDMRDDPQARSDDRKHHAQGFDMEGYGDAGQNAGTQWWCDDDVTFNRFNMCEFDSDGFIVRHLRCHGAAS